MSSELKLYGKRKYVVGDYLLRYDYTKTVNDLRLFQVVEVDNSRIKLNDLLSNCITESELNNQFHMGHIILDSSEESRKQLFYILGNQAKHLNDELNKTLLFYENLKLLYQSSKVMSPLQRYSEEELVTEEVAEIYNNNLLLEENKSFKKKAEEDNLKDRVRFYQEYGCYPEDLA